MKVFINYIGFSLGIALALFVLEFFGIALFDPGEAIKATITAWIWGAFYLVMCREAK